MNDDELRYPIGKFSPQETYSRQELNENIQRIATLPARIEAGVGRVTQKQLSTAYREGGWTARQVSHQHSDSHMNAYIRFKWTLTENTPTIKAYDEKLWAEAPEAKMDPILSLDLLKAL